MRARIYLAPRHGFEPRFTARSFHGWAMNHTSDSALRFVSLLQVALATGQAHIADRSGGAPDAPERWGWRRNQDAGRWVPRGTRIGWVKGNDLFLEPMVSYEVAQQIAGAQPIPITAQTLRQRLREHDLLASVDVGREMLLVRRTLEGTSKQVLHLKTTRGSVQAALRNSPMMSTVTSLVNTPGTPHWQPATKSRPTKQLQFILATIRLRHLRKRQPDELDRSAPHHHHIHLRPQ